jgi:hypothetical protein
VVRHADRLQRGEPDVYVNPDDAAARNRWMVIQAMRALGFALAVLGILMSQDAVNFAGEVNREVGYGLIAIGLLDGFVMPQVMARKWRSPRE